MPNVVALIDYGADLDVRSRDGLSAFDVAVITGQQNLRSILDPNGRNRLNR